MARKKNQSSMEEGLARYWYGFGGGGGAIGEMFDANGGEKKKNQTSMVSAAKNRREFHIFIHVVCF